MQRGRLAIEPTVDLGTQSIKQGGLLELDISDWHYDTITGIEVGGVPVTERWRGRRPRGLVPRTGRLWRRSDFIVVMPPGVRLGEQQLKLIGTTTDEQDPMGQEIRTPSPRLDRWSIPSTWRSLRSIQTGIPEVVLNQEFTIEGRGFNTESGACIQSVKFGDVTFDETTAGVECGLHLRRSAARYRR